MSEFLDELARSLAKPMSRSRSLRLVAGALVAAATPNVLGRGAPAARAGRRATPGCPTETCAYRPIQFACPDPGENDPNPGQPCGPGIHPLIPECCDAGEKCCSDGPPGGNFPGHCTGSSEVSRQGFYCCPQSCECYKGICCAPGTMRGVDKTGFPICCDPGETLCDQPQARGGVICCRKRCGPDITDALDEALSRVESVFTDWSLYRRNVACNGLTSVAAIFGWDITQLSPYGREKFINSYRPDCGTCEAYGAKAGYSVQVGRDCHFVGSVNYVAYGKMMRLCHDHFRDSVFSYATKWYTEEYMATYVAIHKSRTGTPAKNLDASVTWARRARHGWPDTSRTPPGDAEGCDKCPNEYAGPGFTVQWFPFVIRPKR